MENGLAIKLSYWVPTDQPATFEDLVSGIGEFKAEVQANYTSVVRGRPAGAGGGIGFFVEIISSFNLSHFLQLILDGIAYDLIKHGAKAFVLRPFIIAYNKLCRDNDDNIELAELKFEFQDAILIIHNLYNASFWKHLEKIFKALAENYDFLYKGTGACLDTIHIPVLENPDQESRYKFRIVANIDETIIPNGSQDYFGFWGIEYLDGHSRRVYDVKRNFLIDAEFCTLGQYLDECYTHKNVTR